VNIIKQNSIKAPDTQTTFVGTNHYFLNLEDASFVHSEQAASYQLLEQKRSLKDAAYAHKRSFGKTIMIDQVTNKIEEVVNDGEASIFEKKSYQIYDRIKSGDADLDDLADEYCEVEKLVERLSIQKPFQMKLGSVQYL